MADEKKITPEAMMDEIFKLAQGLAGITAAVADMQSKLDGAGKASEEKKEESTVSSEEAWASLFN